MFANPSTTCGEEKSCGVRENELRFSQELRDGDRRETVSSVILRLVADAEYGQGQAIAALNTRSENGGRSFGIRLWAQPHKTSDRFSKDIHAILSVFFFLETR